MVVDSLISTAKVCDCVISRMVLTGMCCGLAKKYPVPAINIVSSVFSLADCTLEKQFSTRENWI